MLLTCPHCTAIFRIDASLITQGGQIVRCSICDHVWIASPGSPSASQPVVQSADSGVAESPRYVVNPLSVARYRLKHLWKPCLAAVFVASFASGLLMSRDTITAYLPFLISGFDRIGLSISPPVAQLHVSGLNASYVGDTMRLSGELRNIGMWRAHAADLRVTVRGVDGMIMQETVIRPDDKVIDPQAQSRFFLQLVVGAGHEAHVTVTPLDNRVYR